MLERGVPSKEERSGGEVTPAGGARAAVGRDLGDFRGDFTDDVGDTGGDASLEELASPFEVDMVGLAMAPRERWCKMWVNGAQMSAKDNAKI